MPGTTKFMKASRFHEPPKYEWIDVVRGIAILMVVSVHCSKCFDESSDLIQGMFRYGQLGVQLFFVASAITLSLSMRARDGEAAPIKYFYLRRFFRIAPLYYLAILSDYLISLWFNPKALHLYSWANILTNVFFVHAFYPAGINSVPGGWSIGAEMSFYALFPFLNVIFLKAQTWKKQAALMSALMVGCAALELLLGITFHHWVQNNNFLYYSLLNQLPVFIIGMMAVYFLQSRLERRRGILLIIAAIGATRLLWDSDMRMAFFLVPIASSVGFVAFVILLSQAEVVMPRVLVKMGRLSYSMYIFHFVFVMGFWWMLRRVGIVSRPVTAFSLLLVAVLLCTWVASIVSERFVEQAGIRLGRLVIKAIDSKSAIANADRLA